MKLDGVVLLLLRRIVRLFNSPAWVLSFPSSWFSFFNQGDSTMKNLQTTEHLINELSITIVPWKARIIPTQVEPSYVESEPRKQANLTDAFSLS